MRSWHEGKRHSFGRGERYVPPERGQLALPGLNERMVQSGMGEGRRLLGLLPNLRFRELSPRDLLKAVVALGALVGSGLTDGITSNILFETSIRNFGKILKGKIKK